MKKCLLILLLIFTLHEAFSVSVLLSEIGQFCNLTKDQYEVLEDPSNSLKYEDIIGLKNNWKQLHYYENLTSTYWLKIHILNDTKENGKWVLEIIDPHVDSISFYQLNGQTSKQGFNLPFSTRHYQHKNHVFDLDIPKQHDATIYLKINASSHVSFSTKLQTSAFFAGYSLAEYFFLGLFYGFLVIMAIYNLVLYFFTRKPTRIFYTLYVISAMFNSFSEDGLGFQYLWPETPFINNFLPAIQPINYLAFYVLYVLDFMDLLNKHSRFRTVLVGYTIFYAFFHMYCSYANIGPDTWVIFYLIPFGMVFYASAKKYKSGQKSTRLLLIGTSLILASYVIFYLRMQGMIYNSPFVVYFFNFTVTIEIILFSIAIGDKLRTQQKKLLRNKELIIEGLKHNEELKDKVNQELEQKVAERTLDLEQAQIQLKEQAEAINEMNLALDLKNRSLQKKVIETTKKRIHGEELDPQEFAELYPNKLKCLEFLEELKWSNGYVCRKCNHDQFKPGQSFRSRRCLKCGTSESPTANTLFHGLRMPIEKSFYLFALVIHSKGQINSKELEKLTGVNQKSAWNFKQRILDRMKSLPDTKISWNILIFTSDNKRLGPIK